MFRKPTRLSLFAALLVGSGIFSTTAVLMVGGQSAVAASKGVTCPDNTTGVTDESWNIVCTGQTAAAATVTIASAKATSLSITVTPATTSRFVFVSGSYGTTDAAVQLTYGTQAGTNDTIDIIVTPPGGAAPGGVTMQGGSGPHFYRLIYRP